MKLLTFFAIAHMVGCASLEATQELNPKVYYKNDIKFKVNDQSGRGTLVAKAAKKYLIDIETPGKIDLIKITSCHRQESTEDIPSGWFSKGRKYQYSYIPNDPVETSGSCMIRVEAYEAGVQARHSSGVIEFETPQEALEAVVLCNGKNDKAHGTAICESLEGLEQSIKFSKPVLMATEDRCSFSVPMDKMTFNWQMKNRECTYAFESFDGERFRLQTIGYEEIAIRGN